MKYEELELRSGTQTFIFITRGKTKPFTHLEALQYLDERTENPTVGSTLESFLEEEGILEECSPDVPVSTWQIPRDKHRETLFRTDLMSGLGFCATKYGQSVEVLIAEAHRLGFSALINTNVAGG